jgi:hypothetical protein
VLASGNTFLLIITTISGRLFWQSFGVIRFHIMSKTTPFPLEKVTESQLQLLGEILWSWSLGSDCPGVHCKGCTEEGCIARRSKRLSRFFENYKDLTASYDPDITSSALSSHDDLFRIIRALKYEPDIPRAEVVVKLFKEQSGLKPPALED